jgi:protein-disulfide isomerase
MSVTRRTAILAAAALPGVAAAQADPRLAERAVGRTDAALTVIEYFSLTCGHCANFHNNTWPRVKTELVETGRIRMVLADFPLDDVALRAAMVARSLPPERYDAFISTLFATQNRWAFAQGRQMDELAQIAALAGMDRASFDAATRDEALARGILEARVAGQTRHNIRATPSFVFGQRTVSGALSFDEFRRNVERGGAA